jgi:hypothetical protein
MACTDSLEQRRDPSAVAKVELSPRSSRNLTVAALLARCSGASPLTAVACTLAPDSRLVVGAAQPATAPVPGGDTRGRLVMFGGSGAARAALLMAELDAVRGHTASLQHVLPLRPGQAWPSCLNINYSWSVPR